MGSFVKGLFHLACFWGSPVLYCYSFENNLFFFSLSAFKIFIFVFGFLHFHYEVFMCENSWSLLNLWLMSDFHLIDFLF